MVPVNEYDCQSDNYVHRRLSSELVTRCQSDPWHAHSSLTYSPSLPHKYAVPPGQRPCMCEATGMRNLALIDQLQDTQSPSSGAGRYT